MQKQGALSVWDFSNARENGVKLPVKEKKRLQGYTREEVEELATSNDSPRSERYWQVRVDAALLLHHHTIPIQRHEAAFTLGAFHYQNDLEKYFAVRHLRHAMRNDPSPVARHEAIEALGSSNILCIASIGAAADMTKINRFWPDYKDVQATTEESLNNILGWLKARGHKKAVHELQQWRNLPRLQMPAGTLTGDLNEALHIYQENTKGARQ